MEKRNKNKKQIGQHSYPVRISTEMAQCAPRRGE